MKRRVSFCVGGHHFALTMESGLYDELIMTPYQPFVVEEAGDTLFEVEVIEELNHELSEPILIANERNSEGMPKVDIYSIENGFIYNITMPYNDIVNASVAIDSVNNRSSIKLEGSAASMTHALNNALILSYMSFTIEHATLLLHASTIIKDGFGYAFLGKSGTGKSTHSRMWLEAFDDAELLNDDHPIVRAFDDGTTTIYGSPWSGKTPCYRNLSAPLKAIVRIERGAVNELIALRPIQAFASLTTSCSGAQWSKELMDCKVKGIEKIITTIKNYTIKCLPNTEAAETCFNGIK